MQLESVRYAAPTGTILIRWDGARQPTIWTVPRPEIEPLAARLELARRYLHVFGPTTPASFAPWAGIGPVEAAAAFDSLDAITDAGADTDRRRLDPDARRAGVPRARPTAAAARLLPSGDAYFLLQGADRELLVPDAERRGELWTSRVWPGAVLVGGEIVGTWRRAQANLTVQPWQRLSHAACDVVEAEAAGLPLPGVEGPIIVRWDP